MYYGNVWDALKFPFLSQQLFSANSSSTLFEIYNQSAILDSNFELDRNALEVQGLPFFSATNGAYLLTTNLGITATITHIILWNRDAVSSAFAFDFKSIFTYLKHPRLLWERKPATVSEAELDPHYRMMLAYKEVPAWWYVLILVTSIITGIACIYVLGSTLRKYDPCPATVAGSLCTTMFQNVSLEDP